MPEAVQEAVEVYCEGEQQPLPAPTPLEELANDEQYRDGVWMLIDVDVSRLDTRPVRVNVSLPGALIQRIDTYARAHHLTRSGFLARAAEAAMRHDAERIDDA